nr:hypothetical protein [Bacillaceae bacterium]
MPNTGLPFPGSGFPDRRQAKALPRRRRISPFPSCGPDPDFPVKAFEQLTGKARMVIEPAFMQKPALSAGRSSAIRFPFVFFTQRPGLHRLRAEGRGMAGQLPTGPEMRRKNARGHTVRQKGSFGFRPRI